MIFFVILCVRQIIENGVQNDRNIRSNMSNMHQFINLDD